MNDPYYPISPKDCEALEFLCSKFNRKIEILEIGCGHSTSILNKFGDVDIVEIQQTRINNVQHRKAYNIDSMSFVPERKYDLIFIDGQHTYEHIKHDVDILSFALKDGGIICGHDFESFSFHPDHIHEDYYDGKHNGVIKAVTEKFNNVKQYEGSSVWYVI